MKPRVAAIVVTYNRKELLRENIESLIAQTFRKCLDIVVIDNASTDGTREYISEYIDSGEIIYQNTGSNLGGAGGFQYGIRYAAENGYDYVWLMDDDCMPKKNALEELIKCGRELHGKFGFLSSKVVWTDGSICKMNGQAIGLRTRVTDFDKPLTKIVTATFVSIFIPIKAVKKVGLPLKEFFIWCDDIEYTRRISKRYPCYLVTASVAVHKTKNNIGSNIALDEPERIDRYNYAYRNEVYYFRHQGVQGNIYFLLRLVTHIMKVVLLADSYKMKRLSVIFKATLEGVRFDPKIEYIK